MQKANFCLFCETIRMSLTARIGNREWENKTVNRKLKGKFFYFFYFLVLDLHIFFIDIKVLYQKCSKFKERNELMTRKEVTFEQQILFKDKHTNVFSRRIEAIMFLILQKFCSAWGLRTAHCFRRGVYSFWCSLVLLYEQTIISHFM